MVKSNAADGSRELSPSRGTIIKIVVALPADRTKTGTLTLQDDDRETVAGPYTALGKADNEWSAKMGNLSRDSTEPYGDTPTGTYDVVGYKETGSGAYSDHSYGGNGAIANPDVG